MLIFTLNQGRLLSALKENFFFFDNLDLSVYNWADETMG